MHEQTRTEETSEFLSELILDSTFGDKERNNALFLEPKTRNPCDVLRLAISLHQGPIIVITHHLDRTDLVVLERYFTLLSEASKIVSGKHRRASTKK